MMPLYAAATPFGRPIVPLHLTLAPMSMIAGMVFLENPRYYLGHEVRAARPVYFGDRLRYSARIATVNAQPPRADHPGAGAAADRAWCSMRRCACSRARARLGAACAAGAEGRPACRWPSSTGASGGIGGRIALALARRGWSLLLQDRGDRGCPQPAGSPTGEAGREGRIRRRRSGHRGTRRWLPPSPGRTGSAWSCMRPRRALPRRWRIWSQ